MAKTFYTSGTGSQQTLTPSQNEKVAIYDTIADAEADLANLEAGQIVATPDTGDENAQPVDSVTDGDMHAVTSNAVFDTYAVITASSTTLTGKPPISQDSVIKIMFTSAISGSNTTTGMSISYNGTSYPVKVGKNGSLANFVASEISSGVYRYLQAYTTLELVFDGTQFIIIGNSVVLSSADYTIYADGSKLELSPITIATGLQPSYQSNDITKIKRTLNISLGVFIPENFSLGNIGTYDTNILNTGVTIPCTIYERTGGWKLGVLYFIHGVIRSLTPLDNPAYITAGSSIVI